MHQLLGRFKIDIDTWKQAIERDTPAHKGGGMHFQQVWRNADDPSEIYFLFDIDDLATVRDFLQRAGALDPAKQASGEIPTLTFLAPA